MWRIGYYSTVMKLLYPNLMKHGHHRGIERKRGQALLEYVVVLGVLLSVMLLCGLLMYAFKIYGGRVLSLMSSA